MYELNKISVCGWLN